MSGHIALIGAGAMGGAIGARLATTGTTLHVFDLDAAKVAELTARGALAARTEAKAATDAVLARFFTGRIHHHVTEAHDFPL